MKNKVLDLLIKFLTFLKGKEKSHPIKIEDIGEIVTDLPTKQSEFDSLTKEELIVKIKHFEKRLHLLRIEAVELLRAKESGDTHAEGYYGGLMLAIEILEPPKK